MNVSLTPELEKLVQEKVTSGLYQTAAKSSARRCGSSRSATNSTLPCASRFSVV